MTDGFSESSIPISCPICFHSNSNNNPFLITNCNHSVCQSCFLQVFHNSTKPSIETAGPWELNRTNKQEINDYYENEIIYSCYSYGKCPMCRRILNMLDLKSDMDTKWKYYQECEHDYPMQGTVYHDTRGDLNGNYHGRFHFPSKNDKIKPYVSFEFINKSYTNIKCKNKKGISCKEVQKEWLFHTPSKTFHGIIDWNDNSNIKNSPLDGSTRWEIIITFSTDFQYIRNGGIIKHWNRKPYFPHSSMEGQWLVRWKLTDGNKKVPERKIQVISNQFQLDHVRYTLTFCRNTCRFVWPGMTNCKGEPIEQVMEGILKKNSNNDIITWKVNNDNYIQITWKKLNNCTIPSITFEKFGMGKNHLFYQQIIRLDQELLSIHPMYDNNSLWNNVFIQQTKIGYASYHFDHNGSFISYEHPSCKDFGKLDNNMDLPKRVYFTNTQLDASTRTFRGTIPWQETYHTSWHGCVEWNYYMVFDTKYTCIVSGTIYKTLQNGNQGNEYSQYGFNLNYVNVGYFLQLQQKLRRQPSESGHTRNGKSMNVFELRSLKQNHLTQLHLEHVSPLTLNLILILYNAVLPSNFVYEKGCDKQYSEKEGENNSGKDENIYETEYEQLSNGVIGQREN